MRKGNKKPIKNTKLCDVDIRRALQSHLKKQFADDKSTVILNEFCCAGARADIAVVNGKLHGYEIKSDVDKLVRLENQVRCYSLIFDNITAVVAERHLNKVKPCIPKWWGIVSAKSTLSKKCDLKTIRNAKRNPSICAYGLTRLLWKVEIFSFLKRRSLHIGLERASVLKLRQQLVENISLQDIAAEARRVLKLRKSPTTDQRRTRNGDSNTIAPTAEVRQRNLNWLLSLQSQHHLH